MDPSCIAAPRTVRLLAGLATLAAGGLGTPAAGMEAGGPVEAAVSCAPPALGLSPAASPTAAYGKGAAILGGAPSALDAIRAQQVASAPAQPMLASAELAPPALTPGSGPVSASPHPCTAFAPSRAGLPFHPAGGLTVLPHDPDDFLASKRIRIGRTAFDSDWRRVRAERLPAALVRRSIGTLAGPREDTLAAVNRWVNKRIRYAEDRDQYGVSDFWAGARRTLRASRGDCEDIALVKLQLLAAAGVAREDMILTIARDLVRNADHAVLIVRTDRGWRMLDNVTDAVLDAAPGHDYRAILSFGSQASWLHGA